MTAFWKVLADRSGNLQMVHSAARKVLLADYFFTIPGLVLIILTGHYMAYHFGYSMGQLNWVSVLNGLFVLTGIIWLFILIPLQVKMIRYSKQSLQQGKILPVYLSVSKYWNFFGSIATLIPLIILFLMTVKPF